jgi:hypothetical protein
MTKMVLQAFLQHYNLKSPWNVNKSDSDVCELKGDLCIVVVVIIHGSFGTA